MHNDLTHRIGQFLHRHNIARLDKVARQGLGGLEPTRKDTDRTTILCQCGGGGPCRATRTQHDHRTDIAFTHLRGNRRCDRGTIRRVANQPPVIANDDRIDRATGFGNRTQGLLFGLVLLVVLLPAVAIDVAWRVVPDSLLLVGTVGCLLLLIVGFRDDLLTHLLVTVAAGVLALLVALTARGGVGLGDVKLIALIGLALGAALPMAFVVTALVSGVAVVPILLARGRRATLPLVPFLAVGALVASTGLGRGLLFGL